MAHQHVRASRLRDVSSATPTTISRLVPPNEIFSPVTFTQHNGHHHNDAKEQGANEGDLARHLE